MDDREEVRGGNIEEGSSGECGRESREYLTGIREKHIGEVEPRRCGEGEEYKGYDLGFPSEFRFLEYGGKREGNRDLMDGDSEEDAVSESSGYPESGPDPEPVENGMDEYGDPGHERDVIVVLVRILVGMIPVFMIVVVLGQKFFHKVDGEETAHECVDGEFARFERFRQDMHERDREHGSRSEGDKEIQNRLVDFPEKIEDHPGRGDEEEDNYRKENVHMKTMVEIYEIQEI